MSRHEIIVSKTQVIYPYSFDIFSVFWRDLDDDKPRFRLCELFLKQIYSK